MNIAFLTTDNRDAHRRYNDPEPYFGPAPTALLEGFAMIAKQQEIGISEIWKSGNLKTREKSAGEPGTKNEEPRTTNHQQGTVAPFEIHVISCTQRSLRAPEKIAPNIWYHSLHVPKIGWLRTGYQGCIRAVRRKLREIDPDIVHGQGTERDCAISAVLSGYPNVLTIHGNMSELARRFHSRTLGFHWLMARLEDFTLPRTSGVFCNSDYTQSLVAPRTPRTWRVDNPIRSQFFTPISTSEQTNVPILLNVGVVGPRKRQLELLRTAERIWRRGLLLEFRFVGPCNEGTYAADFLSEIRKAEKEGYASYRGSLEVGELVREMDAASGLCHFPSEEAFGLVVAEGVARNLKFFGSKVGGIPEIVGGVNGVELFDENDFYSLEEGIVRWVSSGGIRLAHGDQKMKQRFHPAEIARRHLEIYREVLS